MPLHQYAVHVGGALVTAEMLREDLAHLVEMLPPDSTEAIYRNANVAAALADELVDSGVYGDEPVQILVWR